MILTHAICSVLPAGRRKGGGREEWRPRRSILPKQRDERILQSISDSVHWRCDYIDIIQCQRFNLVEEFQTCHCISVANTGRSNWGVCRERGEFASSKKLNWNYNFCDFCISPTSLASMATAPTNTTCLKSRMVICRCAKRPS